MKFQKIWKNNPGIKDTETIDKMMSEAFEEGQQDVIDCVNMMKPSRKKGAKK